MTLCKTAPYRNSLTYLLIDRERGEWNERGRDAREREERGGKRRKERRGGKGGKKSKNTPCPPPSIPAYTPLCSPVAQVM